jgi:hypothetical protein
MWRKQRRTGSGADTLREAGGRQGCMPTPRMVINTTPQGAGMRCGIMRAQAHDAPPWMMMRDACRREGTDRPDAAEQGMPRGEFVCSGMGQDSRSDCSALAVRTALLPGLWLHCPSPNARVLYCTHAMDHGVRAEAAHFQRCNRTLGHTPNSRTGYTWLVGSRLREESC